MGTYKEYLNCFYKEYENRIYDTVEAIKDKADFTIFQNFRDLLYNNIVGNKQSSKEITRAFGLVLNEIKKLENESVSRLSIADVYGWLAKELHSLDMHNKFCPYLNKCAYDLYVELKDFHGIVNCGSCLFVDYIGPRTLSDEEVKDAITILKTCLNAIEGKDGKGDSYCYFMNDCTVFNLLSSKECQKYLPEFLIDYSIADVQHGIAFYQQIYSAIAAVLRTNDNLSEDEDNFWRSKYAKYLELYNSYKDKK